MSERVKEALDKIKPLGKIKSSIQIEVEDRKTEEQTKIDVDVGNLTTLDSLVKKYEIYAVNAVFENGNKIELVYDRRGWIVYKMRDGKNTYIGRKAENHFSNEAYKKRHRPKPKKVTPVTEEPEYVEVRDNWTILIPLAIRSKLYIDPGNRLIFSEEDGKIIYEPTKHGPIRVQYFGRISIPPIIRTKLGIEPGDYLKSYEDNGRIVYELVPKEIALSLKEKNQ